jgi:lipoprotein-releasing system permease protein
VNPIQRIATRYLFSRQQFTLVGALTLISISGVTIGTALLIIVLSVFNGFFDLIMGLLRSYDPDIRIESAEGATFTWSDSTLQNLRDIPEVRIVSPYLEGKAMLAYQGGRDKVVIVRGIVPQTFFEMVEVDAEPSQSVSDLAVRNRMPGVLIGDQLRGQLNLGVGDHVSLLSAVGVQRSLTSFTGPRYYTFDIRGFFYLQQLFEGSIAFVELEAAQRLFLQREQLSGIEISLKDPDTAFDVRDMIQTKLGSSYVVNTWYDLQKNLYDVMYLEKWVAYFILMLIVIVAILNIIGSMTMIVIQKRRDIGALMAIGYTTSHIRYIFLTQGVMIGMIGCVLGGSIGLTLSWLQKTYGLVKLAGAENFIIQAYPISIQPLDVISVLLVSLILCIGASAWPASEAAKVLPADAVRNE